MNKYTIKELVDGCVANNPDAQKYLYDTYSRQLFGIISRYFNETEDAEDILIEAFYLILNKIGSYSGCEEEKVLFCWMKTIAVNTALIKIRRDKIRNIECRMEDKFQFISCDYSIYEILEEKEKTQYLLNIIHELPRQQRTVFNLYALEGYSHKQIAKELGISISTSKSNYSRAKEKLQVKLEKKKLHEIENN